MRQSNALTQLYREIAERHLVAARLTLEGGLHEVAAFHCYHAFESVCCSALTLVSREIPRSHAAKLEAFRFQYRTHNFAASASALALELSPVRNHSLYPNLRPRLLAPHEVFSVSQVARLVTSVTEVAARIESELAL